MERRRGAMASDWDGEHIYNDDKKVEWCDVWPWLVIMIGMLFIFYVLWRIQS
jgi:hypothetical protein